MKEDYKKKFEQLEKQYDTKRTNNETNYKDTFIVILVIIICFIFQGYSVNDVYVQKKEKAYYNRVHAVNSNRDNCLRRAQEAYDIEHTQYCIKIKAGTNMCKMPPELEEKLKEKYDKAENICLKRNRIKYKDIKENLYK